MPSVVKQQLDIFMNSENWDGMLGPFKDTTLKYIRRWIGAAAQHASTAKDDVETTEKTMLLKHIQSMRDRMVICNAWLHKPKLQKGLEGFNKSFRALECFIEQGAVIKIDQGLRSRLGRAGMAASV